MWKSVTVRRRFDVGSPWQYPTNDRSFLAYLRAAYRRPGFLSTVLAAGLFAVAGYTRLSPIEALAWYGGTLAVVLTVGYFVWRGRGRNSRWSP